MLSPDRSPRLLVPGRDLPLQRMNQYWEIETDVGFPCHRNPTYAPVFRQHWIKYQFFPQNMRPQELYELNWGYRQKLKSVPVPRYDPVTKGFD